MLKLVFFFSGKTFISKLAVGKPVIDSYARGRLTLCRNYTQ